MRMVKPSEATEGTTGLDIRQEKYRSWMRNLIWSAGLLLPWALLAWFIWH